VLPSGQRLAPRHANVRILYLSRQKAVRVQTSGKKQRAPSGCGPLGAHKAAFTYGRSHPTASTTNRAGNADEFHRALELTLIRFQAWARDHGLRGKSGSFAVFASCSLSRYLRGGIYAASRLRQSPPIRSGPRIAFLSATPRARTGSSTKSFHSIVWPKQKTFRYLRVFSKYAMIVPTANALRRQADNDRHFARELLSRTRQGSVMTHSLTESVKPTLTRMG
jgi:hypothetical protein